METLTRLGKCRYLLILTFPVFLTTNGKQIKNSKTEKKDGGVALKKELEIKEAKIYSGSAKNAFTFLH